MNFVVISLYYQNNFRCQDAYFTKKQICVLVVVTVENFNGFLIYRSFIKEKLYFIIEYNLFTLLYYAAFFAFAAFLPSCAGKQLKTA